MPGPSGSFGPGFNAAGGGTYAMEWTDQFIRTWYVSRAALLCLPLPATFHDFAKRSDACNIDAAYSLAHADGWRLLILRNKI